METLKLIPLEKLNEHPANPRRHFDEHALAELAENIKEKGIVNPLLVRPLNGGFQILSGSRRFRAAKKAALETAPAIVRELNDQDALELMLIDNLQRYDLNALEEAEGYKRLLNFTKDGYGLDRLAEKIGRSKKYIYDRLKLLELVPEAQKLLLADKITPGHAILLARLKPEQQKKAIGPDNAEVWKYENVLEFGDMRDEDHMPMKVCSVRELEAWIDEHVRFEKNVPIDPMLFPETKSTVEEAKEMRLKVIQITHDYVVKPEAKEGNNERIYTVRTWKLADGSGKEAKTCEKWVTGVLVVGPERGKAYKVCVHKECPVHWLPERKKAQKAAAEQGGSTERWKKEQEKQDSEYKRKLEARTRWEKAAPKIVEACAEKIKAAPLGSLAEVLDRRIQFSKRARGLLPKWKTAEDLLRVAALGSLVYEISESWWWEQQPARLKQIGVDVHSILKAEEKPSVQTSAKKAKGKAKGKKKGK